MGRFESDKPFIVALDFDGTVKKSKEYNLEWETWEVNPTFPAFYEWAKKRGIVLALWTCRNLQTDYEKYAVSNFLQKSSVTGINLDFVPGGEFIKPDGLPAKFWSTGSLKMYADFYVDDLAVGCPLTEDGCVDFVKVQQLIAEEIHA